MPCLSVPKLFALICTSLAQRAQEPTACESSSSHEFDLDADEIVDEVHPKMFKKPARTVENVPPCAVNIKVRLRTEGAVGEPTNGCRKDEIRSNPAHFKGSLHQEIGQAQSRRIH